MIRQWHWPHGPYPVHPSSTEECGKFWCTVFGRHEYYVECTCGWSAREARLRDATAAGSAHYKSLWPQQTVNEEVQDASLHAHELTADDAAMLRMMRGAKFGPEFMLTLPSGRTISGTEAQLWIQEGDA